MACGVFAGTFVQDQSGECLGVEPSLTARAITHIHTLGHVEIQQKPVVTPLMTFAKGIHLASQQPLKPSVAQGIRLKVILIMVIVVMQVQYKPFLKTLFRLYDRYVLTIFSRLLPLVGRGLDSISLVVLNKRHTFCVHRWFFSHSCTCTLKQSIINIRLSFRSAVVITVVPSCSW